MPISAFDSPIAQTTKRAREPIVSSHAFATLFIVAILIAITLLLAQSAQASNRQWQNTSTDFNTGTNWSGNQVPGAGDVANFATVKTTNPNLSASVTIQELIFSMPASGYDLTSSNTNIKLTLTNTGTGTLSAINAANTSGTNTIDAPIVLGAEAGTTQTFTQASGGTLILNGVISSTNAITGLALVGGGTFQLNGANTYTGTTTFATGDAIILGNKSAFGTSTVQANLGTISASTNLSGANAISNAFTGTNSGGATVFAGSNNIELSGTFTESASRSITNNISGGTLTFSGTVNLSNSATDFTTTFNGSGNTTVSGTIGNGTGGSTASALTYSGTGSLKLTNANTYGGLTTVGAGVLNIQNNTALGTTASGTTVTSGAALELEGGIAVGAEALTLNGTGISSGGALRNISGNNSYAGLITLGSATRINSDSGTLTIDVASGNAITGTQNLTFGGAGHVTVNDPIATSTGTLTKDGAGTLTLSAANTYTGVTTVSAGTLLVNNSTGSGTGTGAVTVNNSGTVLGGTGTISGLVTVNANATVQGGNGTTGTTLTLTGGLTLNDNSIIQLALGPSGTHSTLARTGSNTWTFDSDQAFTFIDVGAALGTYDNIITGLASDPGTTASWIITNFGLTGSFTYDGTGNIDLTLTAVPEPSTWIGGALAVGAIGFSQRRRFARLLRRAS